MTIGLFLFKFFFCVICWTAVTSILGWSYNHLCTKFNRDDTYAPTAFMLFTGIGTLIGAVMAGLSPEDSFIAVALVAAPATLIGCLIGTIVGLFFKQKPWPRRRPK